MLAPSFKDYEVVSEQYIKNGKVYIDIKNPKTQHIRSARWYSEKEFVKVYGSKSLKSAGAADSLPSTSSNSSALDEAWEHYYTPLGSPYFKHCRGFDNGPILVIRNIKSSDETWLIHSEARFAQGIGWYIASTTPIPSDIPSHFKLIPLTWDEYKLDETHVKRPSELKQLISMKARKVGGAK